MRTAALCLRTSLAKICHNCAESRLPIVGYAVSEGGTHMEGARNQLGYCRGATARLRFLTGAEPVPGRRQWWSVASSLVIALPIMSCTSWSTTTGSPPSAVREFSLASGQAVIGGVSQYAVQQGDVFPDIARRFDVGYTALAAANSGVDPWAPSVGHKITIPSLYILPALSH